MYINKNKIKIQQLIKIESTDIRSRYKLHIKPSSSKLIKPAGRSAPDRILTSCTFDHYCFKAISSGFERFIQIITRCGKSLRHTLVAMNMIQCTFLELHKSEYTSSLSAGCILYRIPHYFSRFQTLAYLVLYRYLMLRATYRGVSPVWGRLISMISQASNGLGVPAPLGDGSPLAALHSAWPKWKLPP